MFKKIFQWVGRALRAIGSFVTRVFHKTNREQYQMKKQKEKLAKGETEANRKLENEYLARMKRHGDLAKTEYDVGDKRRTRIILSEEATAIFDRYTVANEVYLNAIEDEGHDRAFQMWTTAQTHLEEYVQYLDAHDPSFDEPEVAAAIAFVP